MIISVRKWWERTKFIVAFLILTFIIYHVMHTNDYWMTPHHRFGEPSGQAVKVDMSEVEGMDSAAFGERLRFFYWYGE